MQLAVVGQLSRDLVAGGPPRIGGPPWHAGRALRALDVGARIVAKCGEADAAEFTRHLNTLGLPFELVVGAETTAFSFSYDADGVRTMTVEAVGDPWRGEELRLEGIEWVHVGPVLRGEIDLAWIADGRTVLLDAHGLVRVPATGPLRLDDDFDRSQLDHVSMLKLSDEEAAIVGDVGVPEVIVTHGARGATVNGVYIGAQRVDRDPTGAGDMFAAAYLVSRAQGAGPEDAAQRAAALVSALLR
ncbi:MAG TPA: PfkB family carbohydrate kinase [Gaiellaceae bacterium]|nr:PfkB family carbohydrate kinase [Gaiellaceae bacterium]